ALTVNPNIYVSCNKQFWTIVVVKKVNDIIRLQALVDKKKCMSAKRTSWKEFSSSMASAVICLSSDDLSAHTTKYTSPALTHKVFANIRRVGKGFSGLETPLFKGMLVAQAVEEGDADENVENVNAGDTVERDVSAANDEVPTADEEPSILSPTPPTLPPQPSQYMPSTSQAQPTPPQSPQRVKKLEMRNKVKVLKLRRLQKVGTGQRVEISDDTVMGDVSNQRRIITEMDQDVDFILEEAKEVAADAKADQDDKVDESDDIKGKQAESQAEIYKIDLDHANKVLSMQEEESEPAELQEVVDVVTTTKLITEVVTAASITITAAEVPVPAATTAAASKLIGAPSRREELEAELYKTIDWDEVIDHVKKKAKEDPAVKRYQALKRKPQTEAQARKNMMIYLKNTEAQARKNMMVYLKNVAGFKMDYFKGKSYDYIRPIFEAKFNINVAFLQNIKEHIKEEESRALKMLNETLAEKAAKRQKLDEEVEELKRHLQIVPNEQDDVYTEATPLARKVLVVDYEIINQNNKPYYKIK
nr:hypothetical protein [Tanacetum cinerariifolium]